LEEHRNCQNVSDPFSLPLSPHSSPTVHYEIGSSHFLRVELFRAYEPQQLIEKISPTPLLMTIARGDVLTPADLALGAYARAKEPKQLSLLPCGHFDAYSGPFFERNAGTQAEFLKKWLVD